MMRTVPITDVDPETLGRTIGIHLLKRTPEERKLFFDTLNTIVPVDGELKEALRPFAAYAKFMANRNWRHSNDSAYYGAKAEGAPKVTYGDFRRAARVLGGL